MRIKQKKIKFSTKHPAGVDSQVLEKVSNADREWFERHPDQGVRGRRIVPGEFPGEFPYCNLNYVVVRPIPGHRERGRIRSGIRIPEEFLEPGYVAGQDWTVDVIDGQAMFFVSGGFLTGRSGWPPEEKIRFGD